MRNGAPIIAALIAVSLSGCDNLSDNLPPQGFVRGWHAVPDLWQVTIQIQNSAVGAPDITLGTLEYAGATGANALGEDSYPVTIRVREPGSSSTSVVLETTQFVAGDRLYELVVIGDAANLQLLTWDRSSSGANGAASYGHAAPMVGAVDVYVEPPGTDLMAAMPRASVAFSEYVANQTLAGGQYQLTVTAQGDPMDILFQSAEFEVTSGAAPTFTLLDSAGLGPSQIVVRSVGLSSVSFLEDVSTPPLLRAGHSAIDTGNVDIVVDNQFMPPLIGDLPFQTISTYETTTADEVDLTIAEAGNPGMLFVEDTLDLGSGTFNSLFLVGSVANDDLAVTRAVDSQRSIAGFAQFRFVQGASNFGFIDVYLVPAGEVFTGFVPISGSVPFGAITTYLVLNPDTYDLVLAQSGTATELARVDGITLDELNLYSVLATDNVDPDIVDIVLFDDFPP